MAGSSRAMAGGATVTGSSPVDGEWYRRAFDALYPVLYAHRTVEAAAGEAAFAAECLNLSRRDILLDLACGTGRHLAQLAPRVRLGVGLDFSQALLRRATGLVKPVPRLVRADMRRIPFHETFDVLTNFFTSFGYFLEEEENRRTVGEVAQALKPSGRFFIDYMNPAQVKATLVPRSCRHAGDFEVEEERWIDRATGRVNKTTVITRGGQFVERLQESVRLYRLEELSGMLASAGLHVETVYGDFTGSAYSETSPRMILVGRKESRDA